LVVLNAAVTAALTVLLLLRLTLFNLANRMLFNRDTCIRQKSYYLCKRKVWGTDPRSQILLSQT